ncbi:MAG TPA: HAMP domain-containing sensor histidine kinase, partial [Rubrobacteraceae bacterium]|nr:HAMP domain-containing sensor histidine kinase [Rubrobacteraceae bacterium]
MSRFEKVQPWPIAIAAGALIVVIAVAGLVGLVQNLYVKEIAEEDLQYAVDLENRGSDLETAVLDVRFHHSRLTVSEPSKEDLAAFEDAYRKLHEQIDRVREIGVRDSAAARLDLLDEKAEDYYSDFRPAIDRREADPEAFRDADQKGEADLAALEISASEIERFGERSMTTARENMAQAEDVERVVLLLVAAGLIMALAALAYSAVRMMRMFEELRRLNDRQRATAEALEAASRAKTDFLADVSHELKTPLTVLRGNAELGLRGGDGDRAEVLDEIVRESGRMQRMISDLLFLARSDSESLPLEPESVPVSGFLAGLANRAGMLAREHGASFEATLAGEGLLRVDPARVEQAVLVLVDNAAKYGPKAGRVTLASSVEDGELSIAVEDEGPGIPEKDLPHVFERF